MSETKPDVVMFWCSRGRCEVTREPAFVHELTTEEAYRMRGEFHDKHGRYPDLDETIDIEAAARDIAERRHAMMQSAQEHER